MHVYQSIPNPTNLYKHKKCLHNVSIFNENVSTFNKKNGDLDFRFIINSLKYFSQIYWVDNLFMSHYDYLFDIWLQSVYNVSIANKTERYIHKMTKKDSRIVIVVDDVLKEKLSIEAEKQGLPLSVLGRNLFIQWFNERTKE